MNSRRWNAPLAGVLATILLATCAGAAFAWKPKTHVYLADRALRDVQNGKLAIHRVDRATGAVLDKVGDYRVDSALVSAIKENRQIFLAGVLGPDAYPDIVTGQTIIHPDLAHDGGSDSWLDHLWDKSRSASPKVKVFVAGYLFHAAGDMYAHTYMNHYSGGDFAPGCNALRHLTLEGYIGKKTPGVPAPGFSIRSSSSDNTVRDFIVEHMIRAPLGSHVENRLLVSSDESKGSYLSVPRVYSRLRNRLEQELSELTGSHAGNTLGAPLQAAYIRAWIDDIDSGLRAWPMLSEKIAGLLVYNLDESMSQAEMKEQIRKACDDYVNLHLLSMSGAPDFVGLTRAQVQALTERLLGPVEDQVQAIVDDLTNSLVKTVTGYTLDEITDYLKRPELRFDPTLGPSAPRDATCTSAASLTRATFDAQHLKFEANGEWKLESFPPGYNTVLMTKLILLEKREVDRLIADLRAIGTSRLTPIEVRPGIPTQSLTGAIKAPGTAIKPPGTAIKPPVTNPPMQIGMQVDNAMLGFQRKLDGANQWHRNGANQQMALVRAGVYDRIFLAQLGEDAVQESPPPVLPSGTVKITITRVRSVDDVDPGPGQGEADFYARIELDDKFRSFGTIESENSPQPNWSLSNTVVGETVRIHITLFDEDTGLAAPDDVCDLDPASGRRALDVTYNLRSGRVTGDATGDRGEEITVRGGGDSDRCEITFKVEGP